VIAVQYLASFFAIGTARISAREVVVAFDRAGIVPATGFVATLFESIMQVAVEALVYRVLTRSSVALEVSELAHRVGPIDTARTEVADAIPSVLVVAALASGGEVALPNSVAEALATQHTSGGVAVISLSRAAGERLVTEGVG